MYGFGHIVTQLCLKGSFELESINYRSSGFAMISLSLLIKHVSEDKPSKNIFDAVLIFNIQICFAYQLDYELQAVYKNCQIRLSFRRLRYLFNLKIS